MKKGEWKIEGRKDGRKEATNEVRNEEGKREAVEKIRKGFIIRNWRNERGRKKGMKEEMGWRNKKRKQKKNGLLKRKEIMF